MVVYSTIVHAGTISYFSVFFHLSGNLIMVERFVCPCEPEGCVVWSLVPLVVVSGKRPD